MNAGPSAAAIDTSGEQAMLAGLRDLIRTPAPLIFDVGAHRGEYAAMALDSLPGARVVCFEPSPTVADDLRRRFADNPRVEIVEKGLGRTEGRRTLFSNAEGSELTSLYPRRLDHHGIDFVEIGDVELCSLDAYCAAQSIARVDLLKLDVEGHELAVLEGAAGLLEGGAIGAIQFEFGGTQIDARTFIQDFWYLLSPQFRFYRIVEDGLVWMPRYSEALEIFAAANYVCLLED
jgi:FkbM family methyltransferase